jgi:hypothetical protein
VCVTWSHFNQIWNVLTIFGAGRQKGWGNLGVTFHGYERSSKYFLSWQVRYWRTRRGQNDNPSLQIRPCLTELDFTHLRRVLPDDAPNRARRAGGVRVWRRSARSRAHENPDPGRQLLPLPPSQVLQVLQNVSIVSVEQVRVPRSKALQVPALTRLKTRNAEIKDLFLN